MFLIGLTLVSCEREISGPVIDASVNLSFVNSKGEDLLDPKVTNAVTEENVDIYVLQDGSKTRLYQSNLDAAKFFKIRTDNGKNSFVMFFDITTANFKDNKITQYIR
ncbi:MAG: hypothetical protein EOP00_18625, partial [Pedobacter sp.]